MKQTILFTALLASILLSSCEQSKKGAWTKADLEKCSSEILKGMKEEGFDEMKKMFKIDENELTKCICEKVEDKYESFAEADSKLDKDNDEKENAELFMSCLGKDFQDMINNMDMPELPVQEEE